MQLILTLAACGQAPEITVTIAVLDEHSESIKWAGVRTGYIRPEGGHRVIEGKTNDEGIFWFTGRPGEHSISARIRKDGYYDSEKRFSVARSVQGYAVNSDTEVSFILREIRNPVAMIYNRRHLVEVQEFGRGFGFDFEKADWVKPYGLGEIPDAVITVSGHFNERDDRTSTLMIEFMNEHDGIMVGEWFPESRLRSPHTAPEIGYHQEFSITFGRSKDGHRVENFGSRETDPLLIFRVRTEVDDDGNIIRANYGKMEEGISFDGVWDRQSHINFRNLFFNPNSQCVSLEYKGLLDK